MMEKYEKIFRKEIILDFLEWVILIFIVIFSVIVLTKIFSYLDIALKKQIIYVLGVVFIVAITISKTYEISKPLTDIKKNAFVTYSGNVVYSNRSNKHTDILQLVDISNVFVEAPSGTMSSSKNNCRARVIYGKHSNMVVEFTEIE